MCTSRIIPTVIVVASILAASNEQLATGGTSPAQTQEQQDPSKPVPLKDGQIQFNFFQKMEWRPIIEYYAKEAGLSLQFVDQPPEGTFDYSSERVMSMKEALDLLNQNLIVRDRVLIRNRDLLLLYDLTKGIPEDIIETVKPEELDERGKYEILKCSFDLRGLDASQIRSQVEPLISSVHRRGLAVIPAADLLIAQETAMNLIRLRSVIQIAQSFGGDWVIDSVVLKHVSPDEVLAHAALVGIDSQSMQSPDGNLSLSIDPFGTKIFFTGTPQRISQFKRLVEAIDIEPPDMAGSVLEKPYFDRYAVRGDAELIHDVLQTLLSTRPDVRLDFDEKTGQIFLLGRKTDHELVMDTINQVQGSSDELAVIPLKEYDPDEMIETLQTMFRQTDDEASTTGPIFKADTLNNRLVVRGTPQEVAMAQKIVAELDIPFSLSGSSRSASRFIPLTGGEMNQTLGYFEQMWPTLRRENDINVVLPGDRKLFFDYKQQRLFEIYGPQRERQDDDGIESLQEKQPAGDRSLETDGNKQGRRSIHSQHRMAGLFDLTNETMVALASWPAPQAALLRANQDEQTGDNGTGETSDQQTENDQQDAVKSVPGAPITIRITDFGISLESDDLEALDEIEKMILQHLNESALTGNVALFLLKHRDANEAKELLELCLGIDGGGGGAGGALGGLLGGAVSNAVGGAAGDMLGGLFGGGGSGGLGEAIYEPQGPVSVVAFVKSYALLVKAAPVDMENIRQLVDLIDQPDLGQRPEPLGNNYVIPVIYRDPVDLEAIIRTQLGLILRGSEQGGQSESNAEAQMQQQVLRALLQGGRGGRGGGGASDATLEPPKASLSVDVKNQSLVVTGPEFIYRQILDMVKILDVPNSRPDDAIVLVPIDGRINPSLLMQSLRTGLQDKVEIVESDGAAASTAPGGASSRTTATPGARVPDNNTIQQLQQFREAIQRQQQMRRDGQGRGNAPGGDRGGRGGGGDRGGGDRDGR